MNYRKHEIRDSSPVEAIIGKPPGAIVRWGITIIALVIVFALAASWYIEYPYTVSGKLTISSSNPPATLMAQTSGRIEEFFVSEGQKVHENDILALIQSSASLEDVTSLYNIIKLTGINVSGDTGARNLSLFPDNMELGELQMVYSAFRSAYMSYINHIEVDYYGKKISALNTEISSIDQYIASLNRKKLLFEKRVSLAETEHSRMLVFINDSLISPQEIEDSEKKLLQDKIDLEQVQQEINAKIIEKQTRLRDLEDFKAARENEVREKWTRLEEERLKLEGELSSWFLEHLIASPINGRVTFSDYWGENQSVKEGDIVMTVIPDGENRTVGRMQLPMRGSGRVEPGQKVIVKLESYPYIQYGILEGRIETISLVANEERYVADIEFPRGLVTGTGKELIFSQNMSGNAEVVTEKMKLIERIIYPLRYLIERNRMLSGN
ncbi:MAG: HlyD family efflux transporter periplasmic adaptor subunit [Marinilabiliaceae bacterium]|jgi:HlyD family secretion protein|nr:HlyD family efflux transporter periplasmic adaptor subunit [Marinilabiliaceae bacterium]